MRNIILNLGYKKKNCMNLNSKYFANIRDFYEFCQNYNFRRS